MDVEAVLGAAPQDRTQGFEGLAFRPDAGKPGGGIFYLTHQRAPATVVALSFDPESAPSRLGAAQVVSRWPMSFEDLTAATYVPSIDRLAVIADAKDRLLLVKPDGTVEVELPLPGLQQEGIAFDDTGTMWVADDKDKSLFRVPNA